MRIATDNDRTQVRANIAATRDQMKDTRRKRQLALLAQGRGSDVDDAVLAKVMSDQNDQRRFFRRKRVTFANSGSPSTMVSVATTGIKANPRPRTGENSTDASQQPEDDGVLNIDQVAIEVDADLKSNTLKVLRNSYLVRVVYEGKKDAVIVPLAEILDAGGVFSIDAGIDNATAGSEAVVAGTHKQTRPPRRGLSLDGDEIMVVTPGDSAAQIEFMLIPELAGVAPTLTGETAELFMYVTFYGERNAAKHDRK